jgi:hypothetical protein
MIISYNFRSNSMAFLIIKNTLVNLLYVLGQFQLLFQSLLYVLLFQEF